MKRRQLIKYGTLGILSTCIAKNSFSWNRKFGVIPEIYNAPIVGTFDVIVCGGGPAGIAAAISAARNGAKTCLIELYGCLGGIWTTGLLSLILDQQNKTGIMREIIYDLSKLDTQLQPNIYDSEAMKLLLDQLCIEAGVHVRLYTRVVAAIKNGKRLETIITESNSGREAWKAKCFIDTTGNGDLAAQAGCSYDLGHPDTGETQPMSLMGIVCGIDQKDMVNGMFMNNNSSSQQNKVNLRKEIEKLGFSPSYGIPSLFAIRSNFMALMANHELGGISAIDAQQLSDATMRARGEVNKIVNGLRSLGGVWKNIRLVATGSQIGIREGRRIKGLYTVTRDDIIEGAKFEDAVCQVNYMSDIHVMGKRGYTTEGIQVKPYQIPLRSLIAKDVDALMMAGRCISGDFFAHASYRVTGNAVAMGEAAGTVAAKSIKENILPQDVKFHFSRF